MVGLSRPRALPQVSQANTLLIMRCAECFVAAAATAHRRPVIFTGVDMGPCTKVLVSVAVRCLPL